MKVVVTAHYKEGGSIIALSKTLPAPSPDLLPVFSRETNATPALPVYKARFSKDEVVVDESTGSWWLINATPAGGMYSITHTARNPQGAFVPSEAAVANVSAAAFDKTGRPVGKQGPGGTPPGIPSVSPPPVISVPPMHPGPVYMTGDLVNTVQTGDKGMVIILGYDPQTDQYQADNITRYYSGEWGYRENTIPNWFIRPVLEKMYPHRVDRITLSDVGIGSDSAPPRSNEKYKPGDIISPDRAALDNLLIITRYNPATDTYGVDTVRTSLTGSGWVRVNSERDEKRAFIERDYPYQYKSVDLSLVRTI
jgi:hypothetical protein